MGSSKNSFTVVFFAENKNIVIPAKAEIEAV
jgi:hypothetical protein